MTECTNVMEPAPSYCTYVLDFDECHSSGATIDDVAANTREAIAALSK